MLTPVSLNSLNESGFLDANDANNQQNNDNKAHHNEELNGRQKLQSWINKYMKIEMTDGRILIGMFLCTDRDGNIILGSCSEFLNPEVCGFSDEPRLLGLVMVPGRHIQSISYDSQPGLKEIT
uniref:Sm domain-containing protein n=1 Tax=Clastoptera arizonana TaxID=38151 RepID=A0A1B6CL54_9HEMI